MIKRFNDIKLESDLVEFIPEVRDLFYDIADEWSLKNVEHLNYEFDINRLGENSYTIIISEQSFIDHVSDRYISMNMITISILIDLKDTGTQNKFKNDINLFKSNIESRGFKMSYDIIDHILFFGRIHNTNFEI